MKHIKRFEGLINKSIIEILSYSNQGLTKLPDLSEYINLKDLYCYNNKLTYLPELPNSLRSLYCNYNNLTSLPELPNSLEFLSCSNNNLPYDNLKEYKEWKKDPITWEMNKTASKYNI